MAYHIRKLTTNNKSGDAYGITIPSKIATENISVNYTIVVNKDLNSYNAQVIEEVNKTFRELSTQVPTEHYPKIKKQWNNLISSIHELENPFSNSIVLVSGAQ